MSPSNRKRNRRKLPGAPESDDEDNAIRDDETFLAAVDAVNLVRDPSIDTLAPPLVEQIVWTRISGFVIFAASEYPMAHIRKAIRMLL